MTGEVILTGHRHAAPEDSGASRAESGALTSTFGHPVSWERATQLVVSGLRDLVPRSVMTARRLGATGMGGLGLLVIAVALTVGVIAPVQRQADSMRAQLSALDTARSAMRDQRHGQSNSRAGDFIGRFPTRAELPTVLAAFGASATASGVELAEGSYTYEAPKGAALAHYNVNFPVTGSYPAVRQFIDGALIAVPAAALDSLRLERAQVADGSVAATLRFKVYVRGNP